MIEHKIVYENPNLRIVVVPDSDEGELTVYVETLWHDCLGVPGWSAMAIYSKDELHLPAEPSLEVTLKRLLQDIAIHEEAEGG